MGGGAPLGIVILSTLLPLSLGLSIHHGAKTPHLPVGEGGAVEALRGVAGQGTGSFIRLAFGDRPIAEQVAVHSV